MLRFYLADEIEQLLCSADGKRGNNDIPAPVERPLNRVRKLGGVIGGVWCSLSPYVDSTIT